MRILSIRLFPGDRPEKVRNLSRFEQEVHVQSSRHGVPVLLCLRYPDCASTGDFISYEILQNQVFEGL